jgi:hypothetical protein
MTAQRGARDEPPRKSQAAAEYQFSPGMGPSPPRQQANSRPPTGFAPGVVVGCGSFGAFSFSLAEHLERAAFWYYCSYSTTECRTGKMSTMNGVLKTCASRQRWQRAAPCFENLQVANRNLQVDFLNLQVDLGWFAG